jgi:hypothetical protein
MLNVSPTRVGQGTDASHRDVARNAGVGLGTLNWFQSGFADPAQSNRFAGACLFGAAQKLRYRL